MGWQHAGLHPQRAESFCNLKLPHLAQSLHLGEVFLPVFRPFGSKLAVQGRYNQNLFHRVLSRSLQGIAERPLPCNYNVIADLVTMAARLRLARAPGPNPPRPLDHGSLGNKRHL